MSAFLGHLNSFIRFSAVDGPGNRFTLFLQGCNFNCVGCHNPHTIAECNSCGLCVEPCPESALVLRDGPMVVLDPQRCTLCDICIDVCPNDSTPLSRWVGVEEMIEEIRVTAPYLSGVTVSGGEATLQPEFVTELFRAIKTDPELSHLTTLVDSNGSAPRAVWDMLIPIMDGAMIDLKALDNDVHVALTARSNEAVLDSIAYLSARSVLEEVRLLIMPGYNSDEASIAMTMAWLRSVDPDMRVKVIAFRRHGARSEADHVPAWGTEELGYVADAARAQGLARVSVV